MGQTEVNSSGFFAEEFRERQEIDWSKIYCTGADITWSLRDAETPIPPINKDMLRKWDEQEKRWFVERIDQDCLQMCKESIGFFPPLPPYPNVGEMPIDELLELLDGIERFQRYLSEINIEAVKTYNAKLEAERPC